MTIIVAGVPPRSETVSHASPAHTTVLSGSEVAFLKALRDFFDTFMTIFRPFLVNFRHFWYPVFWPFSTKKSISPL